MCLDLLQQGRDLLLEFFELDVQLSSFLHQALIALVNMLQELDKYTAVPTPYSDKALCMNAKTLPFVVDGPERQALNKLSVGFAEPCRTLERQSALPSR